MFANHLQEGGDGSVGFNGVPKRQRYVYLIAIPATVARSNQHSSCFQIGNDRLHRPFRNTHYYRDIPQPNLRLAPQTNQDVRMIGQEGPRGLCLSFAADILAATVSLFPHFFTPGL